MADKYLVQHRRGTAQEWADKNYEIPREGEIVIEIDYVNSLHKLKIGDGIHAYAELNYLQAGDDIVTQVLTKALPRVVTVILDVDKWAKNENSSACYSQTVVLDKITKYSRLDLQPDTDMLTEFKALGVSFVTENQNGTLWVHSVGAKPTTTYIMQATIVETEVEVDLDKIVGTTIGVSNAHKQPDWSQTDSTQLDFIYNKPTLGALASKDKVTETELADSVLLILERANSAPIIYEWAKAETKPTYTADEVGAIAYTAQVLTEEQKTQARSNIGAGASSFSGDYNDLINRPTIPSVDGLATTKYVDEHIAAMVDSAPETLNTLNELATALGDDPNFATTVATEIGSKVDKIDGKGLSTNDFTDDYKEKVDSALQSFEESDPTVPAWAKAETKPTYTANEVGAISYAEAQSLTDEQKAQARLNIGAGEDSFSGKYEDLENKPTIPTKVSELENDIGYITTSESYEPAGESLGLIKSGGDLAIIDGIATVNDDSHNHIINNVDGLQDALDTLSDNKLDASALSDAIDSALEEAKASGEFDGEDGITPHIGENGNWFTGTTDTGVKAVGKDEVYVGGGDMPNDATIQIILDTKDEEVRDELKEYIDEEIKKVIPVKGVDYYTEADKAEMVDLVLAALPTWMGGSY